MSQKNTKKIPKTAQTTQRHPKGHHENAKETPDDPKGCPKSAGGLPKITKKRKKKTEKEGKTKASKTNHRLEMLKITKK